MAFRGGEKKKKKEEERPISLLHVYFSFTHSLGCAVIMEYLNGRKAEKS